MLADRVKWQFVLGLAMIVGGSFIAGCCGGVGNNGGGCAACREARQRLEAGKEGGATPPCGRVDASADADAGDAGDAGPD